MQMVQEWGAGRAPQKLWLVGFTSQGRRACSIGPSINTWRLRLHGDSAYRHPRLPLSRALSKMVDGDVDCTSLWRLPRIFAQSGETDAGIARHLPCGIRCIALHISHQLTKTDFKNAHTLVLGLASQWSRCFVLPHGCAIHDGDHQRGWGAVRGGLTSGRERLPGSRLGLLP